MNQREFEVVSALVEIVGEYRQRVMTGRLKGDLILHDYRPYAEGLELIRQHVAAAELKQLADGWQPDAELR